MDFIFPASKSLSVQLEFIRPLKVSKLNAPVL